jgi:stage II sporulation protein D
MVPNPPDAAGHEAPAAAEKEGASESVWVEDGPDRKLRTRDVDFAKAFEDDPEPRVPKEKPVSPDVVHSFRYPPFNVPKRPVRVMLRRNLKEAVIHSPVTAQLNMPGERMTFTGGMQVEAGISGSYASIITTVNRVKKEVRLPCTLSIASGAHMLKVGESNYRDALVIVSEGNGSNFSIINLIGVEDYLRGVVPLEIGNLRETEIEAVKAQAVAARTYTYKRMAANTGKLFDVVSTTADQVYGGANAEAETSDKAVLLTRDMILAYENDIVHAYYHSTCGVMTANIEDVWGGQEYPYLRSINDVDKKGKAYCAGSNSFTWTETWTESQFASIIKRYSADGKLEPPFKGGLRKIEVRDRYNCGRVRTLVLTSSSGSTHVTGGDKTRFLLRRNVQSRQILRSANFKAPAVSGGEVKISGSGHGHGIGMCQVGAIGRAREGQNFEEILRAYYSGAMVRTAVRSME